MANGISEREIYKGLWQCRDFEIDHVWQRAVFLSAFLLACYAGYGSAIIAFCTANDVRIPFQLANVMLFAIAYIGLILSLVWIMMAKGSKAWYEHYEAAIKAFENNHINAFENNCHARVQTADETLVGFEVPSTSSWLWNTQGGAYSVAKINIVIGHVSALIWCALLVLHCCLMRSRITSWRGVVSLLEAITVERIVFVSGIGLLLFWVYTRKQIKSTFLKEHSVCN